MSDSENVIDFTDDNFGPEVLESEIPVLVDFWAPWCMPCRQIAPMIEQIADENSGSCKVGKLDIDVASQTARKYDVANIPTLIVFKGGEVVQRFTGPQPKAKLQEALDSAAG